MIKWQDFAPATTSRGRENIEWSITYSYNATETGKPRVLLIGDSICNGYNGSPFPSRRTQSFLHHIGHIGPLGALCGHEEYQAAILRYPVALGEPPIRTDVRCVEY